MTHPYDDYETLLSDVWEAVLQAADNQIDDDWARKLVRENTPADWHDPHLEQLQEDIPAQAILLELLMDRYAPADITPRERDIQRIGMKIVLNPFDRAENDRRLAILTSVVASGAEVRNPAAQQSEHTYGFSDYDRGYAKGWETGYATARGDQDAQVAPPPLPRNPRG